MARRVLTCGGPREVLSVRTAFCHLDPSGVVVPHRGRNPVRRIFRDGELHIIKSVYIDVFDIPTLRW